MNTAAPHRSFAQPAKFLQTNSDLGGTKALQLRPFGYCEEDLAIDFKNTPRPSLETQIITCCATDKAGNKLSEDFIWRLDVGKRIECLFAITVLDMPSEQLDVDLRCQNSDCSEELEVGFSFQDIQGFLDQIETGETVKIDLGDKWLALRKPTGFDQLNWLSESYTDEFTATRTMINSLVAEGEQIRIDQPVNTNWLETVDRAMTELDPLVNFHLTINCPVCGQQYDYDIDFGEICLRQLSAAQTRLIEKVHSLAFHYHWNEREIFALPPWRLQRYLNLIERELAR